MGKGGAGAPVVPQDPLLGVIVESQETEAPPSRRHSVRALRSRSSRSNIRPASVASSRAGDITDVAELVAERYPGRSGQFLGLLLRSISTLGVVYGDIGTSPIYTLSSMFDELPEEADIRGAVSCLVWSLTMVVVVKYICFVMQADHKGEGGIFALLLNIPAPIPPVLGAVAVVGASMLIGDGMITPAMSVLAAFEGLDSGPLAGAGLAPFIVPATVVMLILLFCAQPFGMTKIGRVFGPIMIIYFLAIGGFGLVNTLKYGNMRMFEALNPVWVYYFFFTGKYRGWAALLKLGCIVLSVTGAEALFADLGHFGRKPILISWFCLVYPSLIFVYLGQGAFILDHPHLSSTAFWSSVPHSFYYPMLVLVTLATVIASQTLIAGSFTLIDQAVQLGYFPRVKIVHTDKDNAGQIFIPEVNVAMAIGTLLMVLGFRASAAMSGAYGMAVTGTFTMTTVLYFFVMRRTWRWSLKLATLIALPMLCMDLTYVAGNLYKMTCGGWVPVTVSLITVTLMLTWNWGRIRAQNVASSPAGDGPSLEKLPRSGMIGVFVLEAPLSQAAKEDPSGAAATQALQTHAQSAGTLPGHCILLATIFEREVPVISNDERVTRSYLGKRDAGNESLYVEVSVGFAETLADLNIEALLEPVFRELRSDATLDQVRYYLNSTRYRPSQQSARSLQQFGIHLFNGLHTTCRSLAVFLHLPLERVVLVGKITEL